MCSGGGGGGGGLAELKDAELKSLALRVLLSQRRDGGEAAKQKATRRTQGRDVEGEKKKDADKKRAPLCPDSLKEEDHQ